MILYNNIYFSMIQCIEDNLSIITVLNIHKKNVILMGEKHTVNCNDNSKYSNILLSNINNNFLNDKIILCEKNIINNHFDINCQSKKIINIDVMRHLPIFGLYNENNRLYDFIYMEFCRLIFDYLFDFDNNTGHDKLDQQYSKIQEITKININERSKFVQVLLSIKKNIEKYININVINSIKKYYYYIFDERYVDYIKDNKILTHTIYMDFLLDIPAIINIFKYKTDIVLMCGYSHVYNVINIFLDMFPEKTDMSIHFDLLDVDIVIYNRFYHNGCTDLNKLNQDICFLTSDKNNANNNLLRLKQILQSFDEELSKYYDLYHIHQIYINNDQYSRLIESLNELTNTYNKSSSEYKNINRYIKYSDYILYYQEKSSMSKNITRPNENINEIKTHLLNENIQYVSNKFIIIITLVLIVILFYYVYCNYHIIYNERSAITTATIRL